MRFKLHATLRMVMDSQPIPFHPTKDMNHPFIHCLQADILPDSHFIVVMVSRLTVMIPQCLCSCILYFILIYVTRVEMEIVTRV